MSGGSKPEGGWLSRIKNGTAGTTAVVFSGTTADEPSSSGEPASHDENAPRLTTRTLDVARFMLGDPRAFHHPRNIARVTGVPLGTIPGILARLQNAEWARSQLEQGVRLYRLTAEGVRALSEAVGAADGAATPAAVPASTPEPTSTPEPESKTAVREERPSPRVITDSVRNVWTHHDEERTWTMAELAAEHPWLVDAVRREIGRES